MGNCKHIYQDIKKLICPDCGRDTHETDWSFQHQLQKEWHENGHATYGGWWSI